MSGELIGGLAVALGIVAMIVIHEAGHFVAAKALGMKVTEFFFGFGPKLFSFRRGETEYGAKALPFGGYVRIVGMNPYEEISPEDQGRTYRERPFWAKSVVVLAGIASHFVVAFLLFFLVFGAVGLRDFERPLPMVAQVLQQTEDGRTTPAARAGLRSGDRIVEVDGRPVAGWDQLVEAIASRPGEELVLLLERNGERRVVVVETLVIPHAETEEEIGFLGVRPDFATTRLGPVAAAGRAGVAVGQATTASVVGLGRLVHPETFMLWIEAILTGSDVAPEVRPTSPVGLVRFGAEAQGLGFEVILGLLAAVNVFIGVLNFIPLYPLDGGHFTVALYEKLTGREADVRKLIPVAMAVIFFFILLGIVAVYFDIVGPVPGLG